MITPEKLQSYEKYETEIDAFITRKKMADEMLFQAIQMQATQLHQYARNIKDFVDKFEIGSARTQIPFLKQGTEYLENLISEATGRIENNEH